MDQVIPSCWGEWRARKVRGKVRRGVKRERRTEKEGKREKGEGRKKEEGGGTREQNTQIQRCWQYRFCYGWHHG
jgi:hypothetical protein